MAIFGVDLSDFDRQRGPVDVAAMARDGIVFVTHKATEGTHIQHAYYGPTLNAARTAAIPVTGAYMVPRTPGNNGHGTIPQQVAYFLAYLDTQTPWWRSTPEFFIQVDTEHWGYDNVAPVLGAQACALLKQQTGKWVVHYAPRWAYGDTIPGDEPLWASSYGTNPAVPYRQAYPGDDSPDWTAYSGRVPTFLQFGSQLTIGSQPGCDANAFRGTLDQLRALVTEGSDMAGEIADAALSHLDGRNALGEVYNRIVAGRSDIDPQYNSPNNLTALSVKIDKLSEAACGQPTQEQVDAAVLKALQDPTVAKGIGDAIASHLHVS